MSEPATLPPARHEPSDGLPGVVVLTGGGIAIGLALVLAAATWVTRTGSREMENSHAKSGIFSFENGPQVTTSVARDWIVQDGAVHEHLETYGWMDRGTGIVRIPIDRAMELLASESARESPTVRREVTP